jgi:hypothetical protein
MKIKGLADNLLISLQLIAAFNRNRQKRM